mgnify:CR=1 FL=1
MPTIQKQAGIVKVKQEKEEGQVLGKGGGSGLEKSVSSLNPLQLSLLKSAQHNPSRPLLA